MGDLDSISTGPEPHPPRIAPVTRRSIIRDSLAVGIATGAYGLSMGAVSVSAGLTVTQACALSVLIFTGASQFALVGVIAAGGAPLSGAVAALMLGSRNMLYGLRLAPLLGYRGWRRFAAAQLVIDESTAMSVGRETRPEARLGFLSAGWSVFILWNLATLAGAVAGSALGDPRALGLDAAVAAAFLALLWPRLRDPRNRWVALCGALLAALLVPLTPAGVPVIAAGAVALMFGVFSRAQDPTEFPSPDDVGGGA
jgi:predicted branched-subunit amino acid permease